jgi:hypothetical protein
MGTRRPLALLFVAASLLAAACSKSGTAASSGPSSTGGGSPTSSPSPVFAKGVYAINAYGIVATMRPNADGTWTLNVANHGGFTVGKPSVYELAATDGHRVNGVVTGSVPVPNGQSKQFAVKFGTGYDRANVGLVVLVLGANNYGAFAPPAIAVPSGSPHPASPSP